MQTPGPCKINTVHRILLCHWRLWTSVLTEEVRTYTTNEWADIYKILMCGYSQNQQICLVISVWIPEWPDKQINKTFPSNTVTDLWLWFRLVEPVLGPADVWTLHVWVWWGHDVTLSHCNVSYHGVKRRLSQSQCVQVSYHAVASVSHSHPPVESQCPQWAVATRTLYTMSIIMTILSTGCCFQTKTNILPLKLKSIVNIYQKYNLLHYFYTPRAWCCALVLYCTTTIITYASGGGALPLYCLAPSLQPVHKH